MANKHHKKSEGIDMTGFFREQAAKGHNPFSLVTHVNGKHKALKKKMNGTVPKHDWRRAPGVHKKSLNVDYPDAKPGSDYMGSR